jgi:predicted transcriptional regulator of viral defense system
MEKISIKKALSKKLSILTQPVITEYDLGVFVYNLYLSGKYQGQTLSISKHKAERRELNIAIKRQLSNGILDTFKQNSSIYKLFGKETFNEEDVVCSINPFSYISHLSAMEYHGLTDTIPRVLIYSTPDAKKWRALAQKKMEKDYNGKVSDILAPLNTIRLNKLGKKKLIEFSSVHFGSYINIKNKQLRVSSIGRTFLDMIRKPDLCGGIYNVLQAYEGYSEKYIDLILDEVDKNGNKIEKVRAGYILEERCGIKDHPRVEIWKTHAQRGGSRKLDPNNEYMPIYSEAWCLSINIEE